MNWLRRIVACFFLATVANCSIAADLCPAKQDELWSGACFISTGPGERQVRAEHLRKLKHNRQGVALIMIVEPRELVAVDRAGKVTIPGIRHTGDFDYPTAREGLGRYDVRLSGSDRESMQKCGYFATRTMRVAIPATFAHCGHFEAGIAAVCSDCSRYCTVSECQNSILLDGKGLDIDRKGNILRRYALPKLTDFCRHRGTLKTEQLPSGSIHIECVGPSSQGLMPPAGNEKNDQSHT